MSDNYARINAIRLRERSRIHIPPIHVKKYDNIMPDSEWVINPWVKASYSAYTTKDCLDLCAWWNTPYFAKKKLEEYIRNNFKK